MSNATSSSEPRATQAMQPANRCLALWNESDADQRRRMIGELWSASGSQILQPPIEMGEIAANPGLGLAATLEARGHTELEASATASYEHRVASEGPNFRGGEDAERLGDVVKFRCEAAATDGDAMAVGLDFLVLAADGRIERTSTFVEN